MDSKSRFSSRVENYVRYRPGYPEELVATLQAECELSAGSRVAATKGMAHAFSYTINAAITPGSIRLAASARSESPSSPDAAPAETTSE